MFVKGLDIHREGRTINAQGSQTIVSLPHNTKNETIAIRFNIK
ncbi:MAG: hypothetical protein RR711_09375 [Bacteroides sp.]